MRSLEPSGKELPYSAMNLRNATKDYVGMTAASSLLDVFEVAFASETSNPGYLASWDEDALGIVLFR